STIAAFPVVWPWRLWRQSRPATCQAPLIFIYEPGAARRIKKSRRSRGSGSLARSSSARIRRCWLARDPLWPRLVNDINNFRPLGFRGRNGRGGARYLTKRRSLCEPVHTEPNFVFLVPNGLCLSAAALRTPERNRPLGYLRQTLSLAMQDLPHGLPLAQLRV